MLSSSRLWGEWMGASMQDAFGFREVVGAAVVALVLAGCSGGEQASPEAFCDQLDRSEARLQQVADDASAAGSELLQVVVGLGAVGEYRQMLDDLVDVSPEEVRSDMERARDAFVTQTEDVLGDGSPSGIAAAAVEGLIVALLNQTAFDHVDAFALDNCGRTVFALAPISEEGTVSDSADVAEDPAPTGQFIGDDLSGDAWYTSDLPGEPLADHELPFVKCETAPVHTLWALDLDDLSTRPLLELSDVCNMTGSLSSTQFTHDGRYLVSVWDSGAFGADSRVVFTDTESGDVRQVRTADISARITELTSEGLDARSATAHLVGFDASGGGAVHYSNREPSFTRSPDHYWIFPVDQILDSSAGVPEPVDWGYCYESYGFNPSGTHCIRQPSGSSTNARLPATTDDANSDMATTFSWADMTYWLDDQTVVGSNGYGRSIWMRDLAEDSAQEIAEIRGERRLRLWPRSTTGQVFFTSLTLDEQELEIYEASPDSDEPTLVATLPASYVFEPLPS